MAGSSTCNNLLFVIIRMGGISLHSFTHSGLYSSCRPPTCCVYIHLATYYCSTALLLTGAMSWASPASSCGNELVSLPQTTAQARIVTLTVAKYQRRLGSLQTLEVINTIGIVDSFAMREYPCMPSQDPRDLCQIPQPDGRAAK